MDFFKEYGYTKAELEGALSQAMCAIEELNNQGLECRYVGDTYAWVDERLEVIWSILHKMEGR